jgi:PPOX class probable F420-dependent enzyme
MKAAEAERRLRDSRVAYLATVRPDGSPHMVPIVFASVGADLVTAVDGKPKSTHRLARLENVEANARVAVLIDRYDEDWSLLWWVRADGTATIESAGPWADEGRAALVARYPQYLTVPLPGPFLRVRVDRITGWEAGSYLAPS